MSILSASHNRNLMVGVMMDDCLIDIDCGFKGSIPDKQSK